jgi:uncharacterized protein (TIGR00299 family) protein
MKILYYDCFSGISGDMNLGAMLNLGVDKDYLLTELSKLNIDEFELNITKASRKGITGTKVDVILKNQHHNNHGAHNNYTSPNHDENHSHHSHGERNFNDIKNLINSSSLNDNVKSLSIKMFLKLAEAEAKVHGKPIDEVHFHEVGAVDSIVDTVGAAICIDYLKTNMHVEKILSSSIEVGGGFVRCAHGLIPVPAPATVEILKNIPIKSGAVQFETTTPTGAVILASTVDEFTSNLNFKCEKIAYGIGNRDTEIPNVLRLILAETVDNPTINEHCIIECNIDDMNPEMYEYIMEKLFLNGVDDVYIVPIIMKKSRPAVNLKVLCNEAIEEKVKEILLTETTTLGVRKYSVEKTMLQRNFYKLSTKYGDITIKEAYYLGNKIKAKPEYSECKKIACEKNIPIKDVYDEVYRLI